MDWWEFMVGLAIILMAIYLRFFVGLQTGWEIVMFWGYWLAGLILMGNARSKEKRGSKPDTSSDKTENIFHRLSGSSRNGGRSLWPFILCSLFCIVLFGYRAALERDYASRQKTSFGTIDQCEYRGRGDQNYCHYTFSVGDEEYAATSRADTGVGFGQTVTVYYDDQDPQISSLEDFSERSRHDFGFACILGFALPAVVGFVLWGRAPSGEAAEKQTL